ncbi:MAG: tetratricopeptide repeat protein [Bacteroidia bacterium]
MENNHVILDADFAELITKLGDRFRDSGNITESIAYIEQAQKNYLELGHESYFIACLERMGHIYIQIGELEKGFSMICEADEKMKRLCNQFPDNLDYKETQSIIYQRIGDYHQQIGYINEALAFYQKEHLIKENLHKHYVLQNTKAKTQHYTNLLATTILKLGEIAKKSEQIEEAICYFEDIERLYQKYPVGGLAARDRQGFAYIYLGEVKYTQGEKETALSYYEKAFHLSMGCKKTMKKR